MHVEAPIAPIAPIPLMLLTPHPAAALPLPAAPARPLPRLPAALTRPPTRPLPRLALLLLGLVLAVLAGCASQPSAAEAEARSRVRFEDSPDGARAILSEAILFEVGKTTFANAAEPVLDVLKPAFAKARGKIIVEGHTDSTGSDGFNKRLSLERAERVRLAIIERQVPPNRVEARGLGKDKPRVRPEVTDHDRQLNRRAEILFPGETVDSLGGREIEGKADGVLNQLSKALSTVKDEAKGAWQKLRDGFKSDPKPDAKADGKADAKPDPK